MMELSDDDIARALKYDALSEAEKITGKSYKEDRSTMMLGFDLNRRNADAKQLYLRTTGDTHWGMGLKEYVKVIERMGFGLVYSETFRGSKKYHTYNDEYMIWWDSNRGLLLAFDTYEGRTVNGGKVYYNWRFSSDRGYGLTSSGSCCKLDHGVWAGDHDCREGLAFNMRQLEENGELVVPWIQQPHLWLCHYGDTSTHQEESLDVSIGRYRALRDERISKLPEHVRSAISGKATD